MSYTLTRVFRCHLMAAMTKTFLAWCAGFFDGEGCVMLVRRQRTQNYVEHTVTAVIGQKRQAPLVEIQKQFGGVLTKLTTSGCYQWRAHGSTAESFFKKIRPHLRLKGDEVDCALELRKTVKKHGNRLKVGVWAKREEIWKKFRAFRESQYVLLPS